MLHIRALLACVLFGVAGLGFAAATARAEAQWRLLGEPIEAGQEVPVDAVSNSSQSFTFKIGASTILIQCGKLSLSNGKISNKPAGHLAATLLYGSCVTLVNGKEATKCAPPKGEIKAPVLGHLIAHKGQTYVLLEASEKSGILAEILLGELCAIGESFTVTGQIVLECTGKGCENMAASHGVAAVKAGLFEDHLVFSKSSAEYKGEATLELTGEYKGLEWNGYAQGPGTKLCKAIPSEDATTHRLKCPAMQEYSGEVKGELLFGETEFQSVAAPTTKITCNETAYKGNFNEDGTSQNMGGITELTFTSLVGGVAGKPCASNLTNNPSVRITTENLPYSRTAIIYNGVSEPQGLLDVIGSAGNSPVKIRFEVENNNPPDTCRYSPRPLASGLVHLFGALYNGSGSDPTQINPLGGTLLKEAGGAAICPAELRPISHLSMTGQGTNFVYVAAE